MATKKLKDAIEEFKTVQSVQSVQLDTKVWLTLDKLVETAHNVKHLEANIAMIEECLDRKNAERMQPTFQRLRAAYRAELNGLVNSISDTELSKL